jgi:predicted DNA-binding protein
MDAGAGERRAAELAGKSRPEFVIPPELAERLRRVQKLTGRDMGSLVDECVEMWLETIVEKFSAKEGGAA